MDKIINPKSYILNQLFKEFFFGFLAVLLVILIYGLFQKDPGLGFFVPYWKKLTLILAACLFFGILAVFFARKG